MTNQELIALLQANKVQEFNQFRKENPDFIPDFCDADFFGTDLSYANFKGINFAGADFTDVLLGNADFTDTFLGDANFTDVHFGNGIFLTGADLRGLKINKKSLINLVELGKVTAFNLFREHNPDFTIDLSGARFANCNLRGFNFAYANLTNVSFAYAYLEGVNLIGANLHGTIFTNLSSFKYWENIEDLIKIDKQQITQILTAIGFAVVED